jgi:hypothetical protein
MKNKPGLPIPFLILILAGVVSLFSILADHVGPAGMVREDSVQMQTVEQERLAGFYFHILSWLSQITPRAAEPVKAHPQPAPVPQVIKSPRRRERPGRIELCTFTSVQNLATGNRTTHQLN